MRTLVQRLTRWRPWRLFTHSLSARLMVLFLILGTLIGAILISFFSQGMKYYFRQSVRPHLALYLDYLQQDIGVPPNIERAQALTQRVPVDIYISGPEINWSSSPQPLALDDIRFHRHRDWRGQRVRLADEDDRFILATQNGEHRVYFVVSDRIRGRSGLWALLIALSLILFVLYLGYRTIRWLFSPVQTIKAGVARIGAGELDHRITTKRSDELGDLTVSINAMAEDLEKILEAKRQLLLAISHELRSPITRAKVVAELLDDSESKQALSDDLREMDKLIGELLETERLNSRHQALQRTPTPINDLIRDLIDEHFGSDHIQLALSADEPYVLIDAARIKLLLKNLIANALLHSPTESAPPIVTTTVDPTILTISVRDHGTGIGADHIPHLTEPFYRVDPSRQRKTGGFGLGLYLCKMIVEAHGGTLTITSTLGSGTLITNLIPLTKSE